MTQTIDERLKKLRTARSLSQSDLAKKARVNKQTIYRIEAGRQKDVRPRTVKSLADALGVPPEALIRHLPLPELKPVPARPPSDDEYSINVPVGGANRNAFWLVARRYRLPIARIVELAPFLFMLAAEGSLERRRVRLKEFEDMLDNTEQHLRTHFLHLHGSLVESGYNRDALYDEEKSIATHEILGEAGGYSIGSLIESNPDEYYDEDRNNPFVLYLKEQVGADVASIHRFGRDWTEFTVCSEDVLGLAANDRELANSIIDGEILLHKMPRELLHKDAVDGRIAWLREKRDAYRAANPPAPAWKKGQIILRLPKEEDL